nr:uncharacterized protein LOC117692713 isoform X2 [Crassostrea gigas]
MYIITTIFVLHKKSLNWNGFKCKQANVFSTRVKMNGTRDRSNGPTFTVFIPRRPPPQDSIYGKIKRAKENSDGNTSFLSSIFAIFCSSTVVIVLLVIVGLVLPIAPIVIGALYLDDCPSEKYIPIYLVVTGSISMLYCCCGRCCNREQEDEGSFIDKETCGSSLPMGT